MDDTLLYDTHLSNTCVMAALAMAEKEHKSGAVLATAVVAAFEVGARITLSLPYMLKVISPPPDLRFQWPNPMGHSCNTLAAAIGAGLALGLGPDEMANALGIAGYSAPVPTIDKAFSGDRLSDMKYASYGWMAWSGVLAALLAREGLTGDRSVLDGEHGFWRMVGAESREPAVLTQELGTKWWIMDTSVKMTPAGTWMRSPMLALEKVMAREHLAADEISTVRVRTFIARDRSSQTLAQPQSFRDTQVSYVYLLAMQMLGIPPHRWHAPEVYQDVRVWDAMRKIELINDPAAALVIYEEMQNPRWHGRNTRSPAVVEVQARGSTFSERVETPRGDFGPGTRPSDEDLANKFRMFTSDIIRTDHAEAAIQKLLDLPSVQDSADLGAILSP
jgi:2-methylcitrate dehydratase PrpD